MPVNPPKYAIPQYVIDFTPRTVAALLSPQAQAGETVALDFHADGEPQTRAEGSGKRQGEIEFVASAAVGEAPQNHIWNFDLLRDRARLHLDDTKESP